MLSRSAAPSPPVADDDGEYSAISRLYDYREDFQVESQFESSQPCGTSEAAE